MEGIRDGAEHSLEYALNLRDGTKCTLLPKYGLGHKNLVRLIEFGDKKQWSASPYANDTEKDHERNRLG